MLVLDREIVDRLQRRLAWLYGEALLPRLMNRLKLLVGRYGVGSCPEERCMERLWDQTDALLITYGDMLEKEGEAPLQTLLAFAENHLGDAVSGIHVLPFFPYSSDDGFSIIDYRRVDPRLGDWHDIEAIGGQYKLMADLVLNHVSAKSDWFRSYSNGIAPARHYFIEMDPASDLASVVRPRTSPLLKPVQTPSGEKHLWATFSHDQIDLDFSNPDVLFEFLDILLLYVHRGARIIRLDAIAYLWKEPGTGCIHLPQTHQVVKLLRDVLELLAPGTVLITETNVPHAENLSYFGAGDEAHMVYQFSLPPLLLHALHSGQARYLNEWVGSLEPPPAGCTYFNFTASHDGIGLRPLEGLLPQSEIDGLIAGMVQKGGLVSTRTNPDGSQTPYELNITYFDALGFMGQKDSDLCIARFLASQTLMLSFQGVPGIYFNSLIAAPNDYVGLRETERPRAINRQKWAHSELEYLLQDKVSPASRVFGEYVRRLQLRRQQQAFHPDGPQELLDLSDRLFGIKRLSPDRTQELWVVANLTIEPVNLHPEALDAKFRHRHWLELIQGWSAGGADIDDLRLAPYQTLWLVGGAVES
mgnify:CR=1 FL=1